MTTIILLLLVAALIGADYLAWDASGLRNHIGKMGGVAEPMDELVMGIVGDNLKLEELRDKLDRAKKEKDYLDAATALDKHLSKMKMQDERDQLAAAIIERLPESRHKQVINAHHDLIKNYAEAGNSKKVKELVQHLRQLALEPKPDNKLILDVIGLAKTHALDEMFLELTQQLLDNKRVRVDTRFSLALDLRQFYAKKGDKENLARVNTLVDELKGKANLKKVVTRERKQIESLLKKKQYAQGLTQAIDNIQKYPDYFSTFQKLYFEGARKAAHNGDTQAVDTAWNHLDDFLPLPEKNSGMKNNFGEFVLKSIFLDFENGRTQQATKRMNYAVENVDGFGQYEDYLKSEQWARTGARGNAPVPMYTIDKVWTGITIDGTLDESHYTSVKPVSPPFYQTYGENKEGFSKTDELTPTVWIFYTSEALYFAARCPEPMMEEIKAKGEPGDKSNVWQQDSLELFLDLPRNLGPYKQFVFAPTGTFHTYYMNGGKAPKNAEKVEVAGTLNSAENNYTIEAKIPLTLITTEDISGRLARGNIRRNRWLQGDMKKQSPVKGTNRCTISWAPIVGGGHKRLQFNFFRFE